MTGEKRFIYAEIEKVHWHHKGTCDSCDLDYQDGFVIEIDESYRLSLCQSCGQGHWDNNKPSEIVVMPLNTEVYSQFTTFDTNQ